MSHALSSTTLRSVFRVSPIFALLWEQWRVTRGVVLTSVVIAMGVDVALAVGFQEQPLRSAGEICGGTALVMLMGAAILFLLTRRRPGEEMSLGYPRPTDSIPLGRGVVIWTVLTYRVGAIGILGAALGGMANVLVPGESMPYYYVAFGAMGVYSYLMAISWTLGSRSSALAIVVMVTLAFPVLIVYEVLQRKLHFPPWVVFVTYLCLCAGLAAWGARRESRPTTPLVTALSGLAPRRRSSQVQPFADPVVAQTWFEWRTRGLLLPLTMLAIVLTPGLLFVVQYLFFGREPINTYLVYRRVVSNVFYVIPVAVPVASGLTGLFFMFSDWRVFKSRRGRESALRPVCSRTLARARFRAVVCSAVVTYGMSGIVYVWAASCLYDKGHNYTLTFLCAQPHAAILTPILICAYFILAWSLLWTPLPVLAMGFWTFVIVAPVAALYSALGYGDIDRLPVFSIAAIGAPASLLFLGTIAGGIWCRKRKLVSPRAVWAAVGLCVVFWIGLMDLGRWERDPLVWDRAVRSFEPQAVRYAILSVLASSLPAFAVFSQAIWVDRLRYHQ